MCTRYDISRISEKSDPKEIYEFENADLTTYESIFKDVYLTKITYRIKENEKKILEVKDSKGINLFDIEISLFRNYNGEFKDDFEFFRAEVAKIPTELQGFFTGKVYIVENDVCLRNKLTIVIEFFYLSCKTTVNDKSIEKLFKEIENSLIKESSQNGMSGIKFYYTTNNIKIRLLSYILYDHVLLGLPINVSHDPKLFLKKSKIFSNQKLKNIIYLNMAIIKKMMPILNETKTNLLETNLIKDKKKLIVDISIIENYLTSIYKELKELNAEIKDIKEDSYSRQKFIAKKIINSIDEYLCNRKKYNEILQDKPFFILIISKNSLKYDPETQRYLKEFKLLLDDITLNEKQIIASASGRNCSSNNQLSKDELINKKNEIDEIEAAIDNSLLDIVKNVQTGRQWFVKEYEESE
jgi:hypothetical protein